MEPSVKGTKITTLKLALTLKVISFIGIHIISCLNSVVVLGALKYGNIFPSDSSPIIVNDFLIYNRPSSSSEIMY